MGAKGAVEIIFREDKDDPAKLAAREAEYKARFANPFVAGARGYIDDVILPHETRKRICRSLVDAARQEAREPVAQARQHPALRPGDNNMFKKILIANRGEIACRVIKTAQEDGHQDGGRLFRRRQGRAPRRAGRRGRAHRRRAQPRELPAGRPHHRGLQADRRRGRAPGLRLPVGERGASRARSRKRASSSSAPSTTRSRRWATRSPPRSWPTRPRSTPSPAGTTPSRRPSAPSRSPRTSATR